MHKFTLNGYVYFVVVMDSWLTTNARFADVSATVDDLLSLLLLLMTGCQCFYGFLSFLVSMAAASMTVFKIRLGRGINSRKVTKCLKLMLSVILQMMHAF